MPTRAGWRLLLVSLLLGVFGRVVAGIEFIIPAIVGLGLLVFAFLLRALLPSYITVTRQLSAQRLPVGDSVRIELELCNVGSRRSPLLQINDVVQGTSGFAVNVAPISAKGGVARASYLLHTVNRGLHTIGPLTISDCDPFGLARRKHKLAAVSQLMVHPRLEPVGRLQLVAIQESLLGKHNRQSLGLADEDFDGLRPYTPGDDLRRVHWLSSARQDELQVRQSRPPSQGLLCIVIDTRPPSDASAALDITTSVAASIAAAVLAQGDAAQIVTTDGRTTNRAIANSQLDSVLDFLAVLAGGSPTIRATIPNSGTTTIAISADLTLAHDVDKRRSFAAQLNAHLVITVDAHDWDTSDDSWRVPGWLHLSAPNQLGNLLESDALLTNELV